MLAPAPQPNLARATPCGRRTLIFALVVVLLVSLGFGFQRGSQLWNLAEHSDEASAVSATPVSVTAAPKQPHAKTCVRVAGTSACADEQRAIRCTRRLGRALVLVMLPPVDDLPFWADDAALSRAPVSLPKSSAASTVCFTAAIH